MPSRDRGIEGTLPLSQQTEEGRWEGRITFSEVLVSPSEDLVSSALLGYLTLVNDDFLPLSRCTL